MDKIICNRINDYDRDGNELPFYDSEGDIIPDLISIDESDNETDNETDNENVYEEITNEKTFNYSTDISYNITVNNIINFNEIIEDFNNLEISDKKIT